ncbi:CaiB/BaiF CoA transferase family protein [Cohaesibacter celericrescens]|uniref:Formyl-CoA transferase n=1 Tax=Cohaesibacter celericrescens TaxID=2067669 RepID=A0A2N5XXG8_9HYPH|nr:CoA transferase [Cohaesibacter celericrescens]PLW79204.1 formyl-CoA transferase [Cohaesibacter celericrescens]
MTAKLPLENIRVVEMSHMIMGPACGMILAQLGAEVIKIEPSKGDKTRKLGGMGTAFFPLFNRGKRSVVLELETEEGRTALDRLLSSADVFIENFRDGQLERQGINIKDLRTRYPDLIIAGHKGFLSGPYEHRPALDEVVQMMSGLAMMTGSLEKPLRVGSSANDIMGGMFGVIGILAALHERSATSKGKEIRIGLFENSLFMVAQHMVQYDLTKAPSVPMPQRVHAWPIYDIFKTRDAQQIFIGVVTDGHWKAFCETYGLEAFLTDTRLHDATARISAREWTVPIVARKIIEYELSALIDMLDRLNIPFSPINRPEDLFEDPHVLRHGGLVSGTTEDGTPFRTPTLPIEIEGVGLGEGLSVPALGADTDAVLHELGLRTGQADD